MSNEYNEAILERLFEEGLELFDGDELRAERYARDAFEKLPEPDYKQDGGEILAPFKAPPMSQEMFKRLEDRTNMFDDPLGSKTLGAINRAIVGAPIDIVDAAGRTGEAMLRGAAKGAEGIMSALGSSDAMAKRMGRDVYGLGVAAGTLAPAAGPKMTPGPSKKAMYLQDQAKKAKSTAAKELAAEKFERAAVEDIVSDLYGKEIMKSELRDDVPELFMTDRTGTKTFDQTALDDFVDEVSNNYFANRVDQETMSFGKGMSPNEAIIAALKQTERSFELGGNTPPSMYVSNDVLARMSKDYNLGGGRK